MVFMQPKYILQGSFIRFEKICLFFYQVVELIKFVWLILLRKIFVAFLLVGQKDHLRKCFYSSYNILYIMKQYQTPITMSFLHFFQFHGVRSDPSFCVVNTFSSFPAFNIFHYSFLYFHVLFHLSNNTEVQKYFKNCSY